MKKRIFVAVKISPELQEAILEWERNYNRLPVRWLAGKNLHVTLVPPREENDENIEKTKSVLKTFEGKIGQFEIEFNKVEYGPHSQEPRLIWAEGKSPKILVDFKEKLELLLDHKSDYRPWLMHLTLARFHPKDFVRFPIKNLDEKVHWLETVNSFVLMESRLLPDGAEYKILSRIDF
jgi:2'-5' RNA ligase